MNGRNTSQLDRAWVEGLQSDGDDEATYEDCYKSGDAQDGPTGWDLLPVDVSRFVEDLIELNCSVWIATPGTDQEFSRPKRWTALPPDESKARVGKYQPGDALCVTTGDQLAVVDVDPRNGGDAEMVRKILTDLDIRVFAEVITPGGGTHFYVGGHPDMPTLHSKIPELVGVDIQGRYANVFLPGTERPKYEGRGYAVVSNQLGALASQGDPEGALRLLAWVKQHAPNPTSTVGDEWTGQPLAESGCAHLEKVVREEIEKVREAECGRRNDTLNRAAFRLGQFVSGAGMNPERVVVDLESACEENGLMADDGWHSVFATIESGMTAGAKAPCPIPGRDDSQFFVNGGSFVFDIPDTIPALWGEGQRVLWAAGEALMITGPQGVGKTTLAGMLLRAQLGKMPQRVLGVPVSPRNGKILYLAMDRPAQVARSFSRQFQGEAWRDVLDQRLVIWKGPPPEDIAKNPELLVQLARQADAQTVYVDSLKDAAVGLSEDAVGAGYNRARQFLLRDGIDIVELHHTIKGSNATIDDVYGSTWITSGAGSVVLLSGNPGDPIVKLRHLKQPAEEVGPFTVAHDSANGEMTLHRDPDLVELAQQAGSDGLAAKKAASALFDTDSPDSGQVEKARRRLNQETRMGRLRRDDGARGGEPTKWFPCE